MSTTYDYNWGYQIKGNAVFLYMLRAQDQYTGEEYLGERWMPSNVDITDGIKIEYMSGDLVFKDSNGDYDTSPDEDSTLNCLDIEALAVVEYVKGWLARNEGNLEAFEYYYRKYDFLFSKAQEAKTPDPKQVMASRPYSILRQRR